MRTHWEANRSPLEVMPKSSESGNSSTMSPLIATHFRCCKSKQAHGKPASNGTHREPNGNPLGTHWEPTGNPLGIHRVAGTHWELMGSENYWQPACQNQANLREIQWEAIRNLLRMGHKAPNGNPTLNAAKTKGTYFKTHSEPASNAAKTRGTHRQPTGNPLGNPLQMLQKPREPT